ncbi:hypothetical protein K402DRAFT_327393 [Aulographum hederae CBS 113979]|uniref:Uncharacterized protein n=1 Tax=Aulographum hederae CBS 113979 TaxID=1176131 RepID=A0A6G1H846_9PEZI|nr:hypothetical protein K402DRAFT_327393 [Aulographum hederae CBS 113979]
MSAAQHKIRTLVWTGAIFSITVAGTLYGANLKTDQEAKKERKAYTQIVSDEQIIRLHLAKDKLLARRKELQNKIAEIESRQRTEE